MVRKNLDGVKVITPELNKGTLYGVLNSANAEVKLSDLSDVNISSMVDEDMLFYDAATQKWINRSMEDYLSDKGISGGEDPVTGNE